MDPLDLREKNMCQPGDPWFGGGQVASNGLAECVSKARAASGWDQRAARLAAPDERRAGQRGKRRGKRRGMGVGLAAHISGLLGTGAIIRVLEDGSIVLNTGAVDIGQGSDTALVQLCAEALKVESVEPIPAKPATFKKPRREMRCFV